MLNRYGLIDIEKILREQGELPPDAGASPAPDAGAAPPPAPAESPDDKIKMVKDKGREEDLATFRRKHADAIYRLVQAHKNYQKAGSGATDRDTLNPGVSDRYSFNTQNQNLRAKFEDSGIDAPFIAILSTESTGLEGDRHIRFLTAIHGGHAGGAGRYMFRSPGAAQEFAETVGELRSDLAFEVSKGDPRVVTYRDAPEEKEAPEQGAEPPPAAPPPTPPSPGE